MNKYISILLALLLSSGALWAQLPDQIDDLGSGSLKSYGDRSMESGDYYSAALYYEKYCQKKPKDFLAAYQLAEAYRGSRNYIKAEEWYQAAFKGDEKKNVKALYHAGVMQKMQGKYDDAVKTLTDFRKKYKDYKDSKEYRKKVRIHIEGCELSDALIDSIPLNVDIRHLSVNKAHVELSPLPYNDTTLIYASLKADKSEYYSTEDSTSWPVRKFYQAVKQGDDWVDVGEWSGPFNEEGVNTGNGAFSLDGERFYFTRCRMNRKARMACAIYVSELVDGEWQEARKLGENVNHPDYTSTHPSVGIESFRNREVLYFASDRPEGKGGMDIWFSVFNTKTKTFKEPKNISVRVNSSDDEITPYYDMRTKKLYYSSNGRAGLGGFDIYSALGEMYQWEWAENVGYPINSSADDLYYILNEDGESGFLVSNREGGVPLQHSTCCDDIYAFVPAPPPPPPVEEEIAEEPIPIKKMTALKGALEEEDSLSVSRKPLAGGVIEVYKIDESGERTFDVREITRRDGSFDLELDPEFDYEMRLSKENYFSKTVRVNKGELTSENLEKIFAIGRVSEQPIIIKNIYYEFDKANLTEVATQTISTYLYPILAENPSLIVEIGAHTDSKGNDTYNAKLSQRRAESVVRYLIDLGIGRDRLKAKGYGESKPIADNTNADGSDNPEGRQKNRRTEFLVVGQLDQKVEYKQ